MITGRELAEIITNEGLDNCVVQHIENWTVTFKVAEVLNVFDDALPALEVVDINLLTGKVTRYIW